LKQRGATSADWPSRSTRRKIYGKPSLCPLLP
jgi:hypothetical protein